MIESKQISVGTTATLLHCDTGRAAAHLLICNPAGLASPDVFLGGADVTTSNGFALNTGVIINVVVGKNECIYGVVASGSLTIHILVTND